MATEEKQERLPPYVSYATWRKLLDGFVKFLPEVIDSSYFAGALFSGSSAKKLRTALRFLGLTSNSSVPTTQLRNLVVALRGEGSATKADVLRNILHSAYPSIFVGDFSLKRAEQEQIVERFERLGVRGSIQRHCISFLLHMAADAEIELSPRLAGRSRVGVGRKSIVLKSRERRRKEILTDTQGNAQPGKIEESNLSELDPALVVILRRLPKLWAEWEVDEKANFIKAFEALLDFVYPSKTKRPPPLEHDNGQIEQGNQVIISH